MGLHRKVTTHVNRSSRTPAGNRWKHEHLRLIWTLLPRSFVIVLLLMVLSVGVASAHTTKQPIAKKTAVKKSTTLTKASASTAKKSVKSDRVVADKKKATTKKATTKKADSKKPISKSAAKASPKPVAKTVSKSSAKPMAKTVAKSSAKPVAKTVATTAKKQTSIAKTSVTTLPKGKPDKKYVRKVITGVKIYAYAPSKTKKGSKKKGKIDRYTSTGSLAVAGRTIAVDPKQIPLGWWVYVEGMGYRKAEDVGGSIKGKKIDVFVNTYQDAIQFGVKQNRTIYVIGPTLPKVATAPKPKATAKPVSTAKSG